MNTVGNEEHSAAAGFYGADLGPVPFAIGGLPSQLYFVVKVFSRTQFKSQPVNLQEMRAGDVPNFPHIALTVDNEKTARQKSEAARHLQLLASRLEDEGKTAEAIQNYRQALDVDSNDPVALNNLALILVTA
jgi:tetratricopeptide (TPR) repeat protein